MRAALITGLGLVVALGGCGNPAPLEPLAGDALPPAPYGAEARPTAAELLTPGPQARPDRTDEILRRSEDRQPDRFDLPPGR